MPPLNSRQKKYLRGLAHSLKPVVLVGKKGGAPSLMNAVEDALETHELIKIKFVEDREKRTKNEILSQICAGTGCEVAGHIGHTGILFRPCKDPQKRKIAIPA